MTNERKVILELRSKEMCESTHLYYKGLLKALLERLGAKELISKKTDFDKLFLGQLEEIVKCYRGNENFIFTAGEVFENYTDCNTLYELRDMSLVLAHYQNVLGMDVLELSDIENADKKVLNYLNSFNG